MPEVEITTISDSFFPQKIFKKYQKREQYPFRVPLMVFFRNSISASSQSNHTDLILSLNFYLWNKEVSLFLKNVQALKRLISWFSVEKSIQELKIKQAHDRSFRTAPEKITSLPRANFSRLLSKALLYVDSPNVHPIINNEHPPVKKEIIQVKKNKNNFFMDSKPVSIKRVSPTCSIPGEKEYALNLTQAKPIISPEAQIWFKEGINKLAQIGLYTNIQNIGGTNLFLSQTDRKSSLWFIIKKRFSNFMAQSSNSIPFMIEQKKMAAFYLTAFFRFLTLRPIPKKISESMSNMPIWSRVRNGILANNNLAHNIAPSKAIDVYQRFTNTYYPNDEATHLMSKNTKFLFKNSRDLSKNSFKNRMTIFNPAPKNNIDRFEANATGHNIGNAKELFNTAGDNLYFRNQRKVEKTIEEIKKIVLDTKQTVAQKYGPDHSQKEMYKLPRIDMNHLSNQVYHLIDHKLKIEAERRGI